MVEVLWWVLRVAIALVAAVMLYLLGAKMIRNFNTEPPPEPGATPLEDVDYRYRVHRLRRPGRPLCRARGRDARAAPPLPGTDGARHPGRIAPKRPATLRLSPDCGQLCGESHVCDSASRWSAVVQLDSAVVRRHQEAPADEGDPEQEVAVLGVGTRQQVQVVRHHDREAGGEQRRKPDRHPELRRRRLLLRRWRVSRPLRLRLRHEGKATPGVSRRAASATMETYESSCARHRQLRLVRLQPRAVPG